MSEQNFQNLTTEKGSVNITGFVSNQKIFGDFTFLILRDGLNTIQCIYLKSSPNYDEYANIPAESFISVTGIPVLAKVKSCTIKNIEVQVTSIKVISVAQGLPFTMKNNEATTKEREKGLYPTVNYTLCLDNRSLDLRSKHAQSIFRIMDGVMFFTREFLRKNGFIEIKTSKLIGASSEGGAELFKVDYFGDKAYLAQSPQLYKQMALLGGFKKVYEIGHVYRAEESNINRYLSEFVGIDLEMEIDESYEQVYKFIYSMFVYIFDALKRDYKNEIENVREYAPFEDLVYTREPVVLDFLTCSEMLKKEGMIVDGDFNRECEKVLGKLVKKEYNTDFFIVKDYPSEVRAFYTKPMKDSKYSYSYDFIMRGEEILSGAERINDYNDLIASVNRVGIDIKSIEGYVNAFKYGVPRHGGCGIGFERLMKAFFDFKDIRYFNMFPRDKNRLYP